MSERDAIADEIERAMKGLSLLSGDDLRKATHAFGKLTYAHSSKIIDALRARDREDGAREMREGSEPKPVVLRQLTDDEKRDRAEALRRAYPHERAALPLSARTEADNG